MHDGLLLESDLMALVAGLDIGLDAMVTKLMSSIQTARWPNRMQVSVGEL